MLLAGRRLLANISGLDEEYFEALEAFEAVQAHDYLVRAADAPAAASCQEASRDALPLLRRASEGPAAEDGELTEADGELTEDQEDGDGSSSALTIRASLVSMLCSYAMLGATSIHARNLSEHLSTTSE